MTFKPFHPVDNENGTLFLRDDGEYFRVIGYILDPAVILENIDGGEQHPVIIGTPRATTYRRLEPVPKSDADGE